MWEELSRDEEKLLGTVVVLGREYPGGEVPDLFLWGQDTELDFVTYVGAAARLVRKGLAESPGGTDFSSLRVTPEGKKLFWEL